MTGSMIGRVFSNRYQITELIGVGGMAEVYGAQDNVLGRKVAVKVMLPQYANDPSFAQRFKQEAASAANLQSPYIVNIYDWGQDDGTYYIVMEYVRGSDLKSAINQRGAINQRKVAEIGSQVCQALTVAHSQDIIHRDIKPQNIMVQPDGNVKVMDFGIARAKNSVKTQTSTVLGTAHYISPEQAQGKELTAASDIYSLGVVLYEAATGELPFDGPDAISVAMKQVNETPVPPSQINPSLDRSLEAIIMKAMAKNPYERFATAKDMQRALNDYLSGRPVTFAGGFTSAETAVIDTVPAAAMSSTAVMPNVSSSTGSMGQQRTYSTGAYSTGTDLTSTGDKKSGGGKTAAKVIAVIIAIIAVVAIAYGVFSLFETETATVPDVVGMERADAIDAIEEAGFEVGDIEEENSDSIESGIVISQDPEADEELAEGSEIDLVVSVGEAEVTVPDLTGLNASEAQKQLTANGLQYVEGDAVYSDDVEEGYVASQDIEAGTEVAQDTVVTYYLSKGSDEVEMPSVTGLSESSATSTLTSAGLNVSISYEESSSVESGYVISQSPTAGTLVEIGSSVSITVSTGVTTYTVSVSCNDGGTISASAYTVDEGGTVVVYITPNTGYAVSAVSGLSDVSSSGGTYTITNVQSNINITVTFAAVEVEEEDTSTDENANADANTGGDTSGDSSSDSSTDSSGDSSSDSDSSTDSSGDSSGDSSSDSGDSSSESSE